MSMHGCIADVFHRKSFSLTNSINFSMSMMNNIDKDDKDNVIGHLEFFVHMTNN